MISFPNKSTIQIYLYIVFYFLSFFFKTEVLFVLIHVTNSRAIFQYNIGLGFGGVTHNMG
ncbi:hypothetical protein RchiOBHm_Chr2g0140111 [Rosa chinensis]|uniref:Uncharacterized protein n=1 Tax=Rosa chinensis TaxID=74649 RepID=A0A2P6RX88_ROSCH|nr:hypothetical protein RchiOBHm_Chr2g0140111 [Rosa chinensis]